MCNRRGFTLAELLISLSILGAIATFTIPKIITSQATSKYNAIAKESAAMVSEAYQLYQLQNTVSSTAGVEQLTPFMNYIATDSSTIIDDKQTGGTYTCGGGSANYCLRLHNGGILRYGRSVTYNFGGTNATDVVWFDIDPDGTTDGTTNGPGKAVEFYLYYNGKITTRGYVTNPALDPPWFSW